ncbi:glycosyltransferase involved in cell wall biosynthesis [Paenibacillus anaericanus]|uniref:bifunctional glycosyltransferase family 2/GtrA family protein n=1 Tax=Paenibacillus anaericanus TaxID=170367 RepID=UPI002788E626|nr:bifunctional glycosyltransferase family 2/GtrA family protein [Paenibacillus anaericanus]MDQ0089460.1 glycosyltransferase involved in cell wall biosynthesis [Paenibacillus anaericanus]
MKVTVLIPAYEPDIRLLDLIQQLNTLLNVSILVVDDGSGERYREIFQSVEACGCTVLRHDINRGKGRALKTGFLHLQETEVQGKVVCADSDGQHSPADIMKVVHALENHDHQLVLGSRRFSGKVPLRSRFGNAVTRGIFTLTTGTKIYDTQTGLRGYSASMLDFLCQIPGERFEYEMNMLLMAHKDGYAIVEEYIDTIYLDNNKSSHFRPLVDSFRVYLPILMFSASSVLSAILDFTLLFILQRLTDNLFLSVVVARMCSSIFNYTLNRKYVFGLSRDSKIHQSLPKYFGLVIVLLLLNYGFLYLYHESFAIPLFVAKLLTEASIFFFSYWAQRKYVY